ncbi:MAG: hypothetical protein ABR508_03730 [Candidatus Baltobacteraceae bacterium]
MKILAAVLGIVFIVLAILAWSGIAHFLPALGLDGRHHTKHGIVYLVLAVLCFVWARMSSDTAVTSSR